MKKLLLTSAIVAVAGASAAEVTWSGSAEFGYATHDDDGMASPVGDNNLYMKAGLDAKASAELDGGVMASVTYGIDVDYLVENHDPAKGSVFDIDSFPTIEVKSSTATFTLGDVDHAAHAIYKGAGSMDVEFTEQDGEVVGRIDGSISTFAVGASYVTNGDLPDSALGTNSMTVGAEGSFAGAGVTAAYEENKKTEEYVLGVSGSYSMMGITGRVAYAMKNMVRPTEVTQSSIGLSAEYEMSNGVKLGGGLAINDDGDETTDNTMSYEVSAGFKAMGADITAKYNGSNEEVKDDPATKNIDESVVGGISLDASYEIEGTGVTVLAGYDWDEANVLSDSDTVGELGAYYVGTKYSVGEGAHIFATYTNGDEIGAAEYEPGMRFGVALTF